MKIVTDKHTCGDSGGETKSGRPCRRAVRVPGPCVKHVVSRPGRPSKLTPETQERILSIVRSGATYKTACMAAGIGERTFHRWRSKGEQEDAPPEYRQFWLELTRAEQEGIASRVALIQSAAREDWRAAAWLLERMDPERWSLKHQVEHSGHVTVAQVIASLRGRQHLLS